MQANKQFKKYFSKIQSVEWDFESIFVCTKYLFDQKIF